MDISVFLLKFWGWYCLLFFVMLSIVPKRIVQIFNSLKDEKTLLSFSFIAIIIGLLNILFHNIWEPSTKIIVTLFGWVALLKGITLFLFPKYTLKWLENFNVKFISLLYLFLFLIGMFLLNAAYGIVLY